MFFVRLPDGSLACIGPGRPCVVGMDQTCDVVVEASTTLARHATLTADGPSLRVRPAEQGAVVYVDEVIVESDIAAVHGSRVSLDGTVLVVAEGHAAEAEFAEQSRQLRMCRVISDEGPLDRAALVRTLRLYAATKRSGILRIYSEYDDCGKIHVRDGAIVHVSINDVEELPASKALFRLLLWSGGTLYTAEDVEPLPRETRFAVPDVLEELLPQVEALDAIRDALPPLDSSIVVTRPREPELTPSEHALLDLADKKPSLEAILNASRSTDLQTVRMILDLIERGYLHAEPGRTDVPGSA